MPNKLIKLTTSNGVRMILNLFYFVRIEEIDKYSLFGAAGSNCEVETTEGRFYIRETFEEFENLVNNS